MAEMSPSPELIVAGNVVSIRPGEKPARGQKPAQTYRDVRILARTGFVTVRVPQEFDSVDVDLQDEVAWVSELFVWAFENDTTGVRSSGVTLRFSRPLGQDELSQLESVVAVAA